MCYYVPILLLRCDPSAANPTPKDLPMRVISESIEMIVYFRYLTEYT